MASTWTRFWTENAVVPNYTRCLQFDLHVMSQKGQTGKVGFTCQTIVVMEKANSSRSLGLAILMSLVFDKPLEIAFHIHDAR